MEVDRNEIYTNKHRAFLQSFVAHGALTFQAARPIIASIESAEGDEYLENDVTEAVFNSYVSIINAEVSKYDFEIRSVWTQLGQSTSYGRQVASGNDGSRARVFAFVNTTSDVVSQLATTRTPDELAYVGRIIDDMFDRYNHESGKEIMAISHNQAVRLNKAGPSQRSLRQSGGGDTQMQGTGQGLTMKQAEAMLKSLVAEGWLEHTGSNRDPYYILTPRALAELKGWLLDTYNEPGDPDAPSDEGEDEDGAPGRRGIEKVKLCAACNEIVISGQRCSDKQCRARLHDGCAGPMWRSQRGAVICPKCQKPWEGHGYVGVRAAGVTLDSNRRGTGRTSTGRRGINGDAAEVETSFSTQTAGRRSSSRRDSRAATEVEDDEDDEDE